MKLTTSPTYTADIYMAGDIDAAKQVCREFCFSVGLCVTVTPTTYVYTGGAEDGFKIGLINYPRFPSEPARLVDVAARLGALLMERLFQTSFTIVTPEGTSWRSRRSED